MELPFELNTNHKTNTKSYWEIDGLNMSKFDEIYERFINSSQCEICEETFKNSNDRMVKTSSEKVLCYSCMIRKNPMKGKKRQAICHKTRIKLNWEKAGAIFDSVDEFEELYKLFINQRGKCAWCNRSIFGKYIKFNIPSKTIKCRYGCFKYFGEYLS